MNLIQRIRFPESADVLSLYLRLSGPSGLKLNRAESSVSLGQGATLSLNTYFNSFYEKIWIDKTSLGGLEYEIRMQGEFHVKLFRERAYEERTLLREFRVNQVLEPGWVSLQLPEPNVSVEALGRVYLEITSLAEGGEFLGGRLVTSQSPEREVFLGLVCVTYQRDDFIRATIRRWSSDEALSHKKHMLFVVDNGRTLDPSEYRDDRLRILPNRNLGGSGGFNRGLLEAIDHGQFTHYLLLDDDIVMDPESILRLMTFYEYAKEDCAVAGTLLDLSDKTLIYETGTLVGGVLNGRKIALFSSRLLNSGLRADQSEHLNTLVGEDEIDCSGFWFFGFPAAWAREEGLLMPFFIHGDDLEFCIRLKRNAGRKIISLPSVAIWHHTWRPSEYRVPPHLRYYGIRNVLVLYLLHADVPVLKIIGALTRIFMRHLLVFEYRHAALMVRAVSDAMKGPRFLAETDPEKFHEEILGQAALCADTLETSVTPSLVERRKFSGGTSKSAFTALVAFITLNGHLLPDRLLKDGRVLFLEGRWRSVFGSKRAVLLKNSPNLIEYRMRRKIGLALLVQWVGLCLKAALVWSRRKKEWRRAHRGLTDPSFSRKFAPAADPRAHAAAQ